MPQGASDARATLDPAPAYLAVAIAAQAILVIIVVSGAGVRTSGSGLGCPDWPDCRGTFVPALDYHTWMEYGNRLLSTAVGVVCVAAGVLVFFRRPFRRDLVRPALVLPIGVVAEGALGACAVLFDLSWPVVIAHYLLSLGLLVAATVLVWRARREPDARPVTSDALTVIVTRALVAFGGLVIVLGTFATAAGPHSGGAGTGDVVHRLDAFGTHTLRSLIHLHGHLAAALGFVRDRGLGDRLAAAGQRPAAALADAGLRADRPAGLDRAVAVPHEPSRGPGLGARVAAGGDLGRARMELAGRRAPCP